MSVEPGERVWIDAGLRHEAATVIRSRGVGGTEDKLLEVVNDVGDKRIVTVSRTEPLGYRDELYRGDGTFDRPITSWREQFGHGIEQPAGVDAFA